MDRWLTERYCLYLEEKQQLYRYEIHHLEWELHTVNLQSLELNYRLEKLQVGDREADLVHYSPGVKVLAWGRERVGE